MPNTKTCLLFGAIIFLPGILVFGGNNKGQSPPTSREKYFSLGNSTYSVSELATRPRTAEVWEDRVVLIDSTTGNHVQPHGGGTWLSISSAGINITEKSGVGTREEAVLFSTTIPLASQFSDFVPLTAYIGPKAYLGQKLWFSILISSCVVDLHSDEDYCPLPKFPGLCFYDYGLNTNKCYYNADFEGGKVPPIASLLSIDGKTLIIGFWGRHEDFDVKRIVETDPLTIYYLNENNIFKILKRISP